jgi:predicted peptidase
MKNLTILFISLFSFSLLATPLVPTDPEHPGSLVYNYDYQKIIFEDGNREIVFYSPLLNNTNQKVPLIVFGHGQALGYKQYEESFIHFARKGIAVVHPQYDRNFFDRKWRRMAEDYNRLVAITINKYQNLIDTSRVVYSGHSKGAYIALLAAGSENLPVNLKATVLFSPAGFDEELLQSMDTTVPLTLIRSKDDRIIKRELNFEIYSKAPSLYKQFIEVENYNNLDAGHFFTLTKSTLFGGNDGPTAFHHHGMWKWLIGATLDNNLDNPYIYGNETLTSGTNKMSHEILKSW